MGIFKRRKPDIKNTGDARYMKLPRGYVQSWERQTLPDPAAQNYSWETLGLVPFSPIGPSVAVRHPYATVFPQMFAGFSVKLTGIPLTQGQIIGQPVYDPNAGFASRSAVPIPALVAMNIPMGTDHPIAFNDPTPDRIRA